MSGSGAAARAAPVLAPAWADAACSAALFAVDPHGRMAREDFSGSDPAWRWIESVAPASSTDGQPVTALLGWVSRETGRKLRYDDPAVEQLAAATILHGRLSELTPLETLDVLLATTDLEYRLGQDEAIEVSRRQD